jgi:hypothetical protein
VPMPRAMLPVPMIVISMVILSGWGGPLLGCRSSRARGRRTAG